MKIAKSLLALAMSVAMVILLVPSSFAAGLSVGTNTDGVDILSGAPDDTGFPKVGAYYFEVNTLEEFNKKHGTSLTINGVEASASYLFIQEPAKEWKYAGSKVDGRIIVFGGLNLVPPSNRDWKAGDVFHITIVSGAGSSAYEPLITQSKITDTSGKEKSTIYYRNVINAEFTVVDPNSNHTDVDPSSIHIAYNDGNFIRYGDTPLVAEKADKTDVGRATFHVSLPGLRYSGKGDTIRFTIFYTTSQGLDYTMNLAYTVSGCKEYKDLDNDNDNDEDEKKLDPLIPYIIVENYTYGGTSVTAGEEFELALTLRNTSSTHTLQNIVMNVSPKGVFSMTSSSNTFYFTDLFAGGTIVKKVKLQTGLTKVTDDKDSNSIDIKFTYQYTDTENKVRKSGESNESITIPVNFPDRFEIQAPESPGIVSTGEDCNLYVPFVNKGRSSIYNLSAMVRGDMSNPGQSQYIGNLEAGNENSVEFNVRFDQPGEQKGEIVITYEDANMNPKESVLPFTVTVQEMTNTPGGEDMNPFPDEPVVTPVEPKGLSGKDVAVGVVAVAVAGLSAFVTVRGIKAKRSIYSDEDI